MKKFKPLLAGRFYETEETVIVAEKYSGKAIAEVCMADENMLEIAITQAVNSEDEMKNLSSYEKSEILKYISTRLWEEREKFAEIIAQEAGKPIKFALIEAERASQTFMIAAEEAKRIESEVISLDWYSSINKEAVVKLFPLGTVSGITPFNFPLNLVAHKIAPAIAAGCPFILKPALTTPLSALELAKIISESDLPKGGLSVLPMTHSVSKPLIEDDRIKKISFTGSQEVGWEFKAKCRKKHITLELGGNAGAIVTKSCDLEEAIAKCVTGAFAYAGQVCIHTQRIFVEKSIYNEFLARFKEKTKKLKFGNPLESQTDISVLIDEPNAIRVEEWINQAIAEGAELILGGKRDGSFVQPTILTKTNPKMKVWKDEIFGPVVNIEPYDDFDQAINMVNDSIYGLQSAVFTNNISEMNAAYKKINAGGIMINESPTFRIDHMPYGGIKESGFGREGIKYAIREMSEMKVLVKPI